MSLDLEGPEFEKTVHDHARYLGLDPARHPQLLWIAVEALTAKVPSDWRVAATKTGAAYFYNTRTRETMWEHPLEEQFKSMVREQLAKIGELSPDRGIGSNGRAKGGGGGGGGGDGRDVAALPSSLSKRGARVSSRGGSSSGGGGRRRGRSKQRHEHSFRRKDGQSASGSGSDDGAESDASDSDGSSGSGSSGVSSGSGGGHSQSSRDAIVELESRLMQEVAQNKILQDQLDHEQALNRQCVVVACRCGLLLLFVVCCCCCRRRRCCCCGCCCCCCC
jgi:centrosomal protein CEP164